MQIKNLKTDLFSAFAGIVIAVVLGATFIYVDISILRPERLVVGASMAPNIMPGSVVDSSIFFSSPQRNNIYVINEKLVDHPDVIHQPGNYIKRVVGMPHDTLTFDVNTGLLISINDNPVSTIKDTNLNVHSIKSKKSGSPKVEFELIPHLTSLAGDKFHIYLAGDGASSNDPKMKEFTKLIFNYPWLKSNKSSENTATFTIPEGFYFVLSDNRVMGTDSRHFGLIPEDAFEYKYIM